MSYMMSWYVYDITLLRIGFSILLLLIFPFHFFFYFSASFGNCTKQFADNIIPLSSPGGTIFSPRYPKYYPPNMRCSWVITVPEGQHIRLSFQEFYLESCASSSIEIRDGADKSSKLLHRLCDRRFNPLVVFSTGSRLWVHFRSGNKRFTMKGFTAQYETITQCKSLRWKLGQER